MSVKVSSLEEIQIKKGLIKSDLKGMEQILTFKEPKASLSVMTHGKSDKYIVEKRDVSGEQKTVINKDFILSNLSNYFKNVFINKSPYRKVTETALKTGMVDNALHVGLVAVIASTARKNIQDKKVTNKILGFALLLLAPKLIKIAENKINELQAQQSIGSMKRLI